MSKYIKTDRLSNTTEKTPSASQHGSGQQRVQRTTEGYTESDLHLFSGLMDYRHPNAATHSNVVKSLTQTKTQYTRQDSEHFARLMTATANNDDSRVERPSISTETNSSTPVMKIIEYDHPSVTLQSEEPSSLGEKIKIRHFDVQ